VSASLLIKENRAHQICTQKRETQKRRETRSRSRALKEQKAFISVLRFFPRHQKEKERSSQRGTKKKKREISREKKPKGGKELAL
jgi:hypothetical protein